MIKENFMNKKIAFVIVGLFIIAGCSTTKFTPVAGLEKESISSRSVPAKISRESDKSLEKKGYAQIGFVYSDDKVKTCWGDDCINFTCTPDTPHKDLTKEVLEKAASHGGDIVVLEKDSAPSIESTTKDGKCLSTLRTSYQDQECSGGYGNVPRVCSWVTKYRVTCTSYETIHGKACTFVSNGSVWRHDPEIGKRLVVILRELKEKERLKNAEKEKKEKEEKDKKQTLEKIKAQFATLEQAYRESSSSNKNKLVSVKVEGKYGFKDEQGRMIIEPQFTDIMGFSEGLSAVAIGSKTEKINSLNITVGKDWGYIDTKGNWIIRPTFEYAGSFSEGLANVRVNNKYGYINKTGQFIIKPQFRNAFVFSEGLAVVISEDKKYGYINKEGSVAIEPQFDNAMRFIKGKAIVKIDGKRAIIDRSGKIIVQEP